MITLTTRRAFVSAFAAFALVAGPEAVDAQSASRQASDPVPVKVDVVISRHKGDALVSSLPYSLYVRADERGGSARVRMGVDVPVGSTMVTRGPSESGGQQSTTSSSKPEYRYVGTSVDCRVTTTDAGLRVFVNIQDSSIHTTAGETMPTTMDANAMAFRTFSLSNELQMQSGETREFGVATDKITGETVKVNVTVNIVR
jgi:hypothetical protein